MRKKLVEVIWQDIEIDGGWHDDDESKKELRFLKSYGILVRQTKTLIVLATTYDPETKKWADLNRFPKGCVSGMRVVEVVQV